MKKKCEVEGCDIECSAKGLCRKHYRRFRRGGDPHTPSCRELTLEERFKAKLAPQDPVTGCIEWTGSRIKHSQDYGQISRDAKMVYTHRLAWELKYGPIPEGLGVLHRCDNPPCCNDEHLFLGTDADNALDREAKGRGNQPKGVDHPRAKLNEADVAEIRRRLAAGEVQHVIAADLGISRTHVSNIKTGMRWSHLKTNKE